MDEATSDHPIQIVTTTGTHDEASAIAQSLVARSLAACAQVSGPISSTYRWEGSIETSQEWQCVLKTTRRLYPAVELAIRALHSYEVPEILAFPIVAGSHNYVDWLRGSLAADPQHPPSE